MSLYTENTADASETRVAEKIDKNINRESLELIDKRIRANLEALNVQFSTLTLLPNQLMQNNLVKTAPTAGSRTHRPQMGFSFNREPVASRNWPDAVIGCTGP